MNSIVHNHPIAEHTTFGVAAQTAGFLQVNSVTELKTALQDTTFPDLRILGGGSNMLWTQDFNGLTLQIGIKGIAITREEKHSVTVRIGAGENWHDFVLWALKNNYGGVENLALIPGNVGAAPIQNIGAYGVELKDVFVCCDALEISSGALKTFSNKECLFGYRDSIFKNKLKGKYIITAVELELQKEPHTLNSSYGPLKTAMEKQENTIQNLAAAVIKIRESKLPNPKEIGNCGSFFKNPIISKEKYGALMQQFEDLPHYALNEQYVKIPAAWLIDSLGFKGYKRGAAGVHHAQPLVLVNLGNATGKEIQELAQEIKIAVAEKFDLLLEEEVNIY